MAFKKTDKSQIAPKKFSDKKAQSIFEYIILTAIVVAVILIFASTPYFQKIKTACDNAFNAAVTEIVK